MLEIEFENGGVSMLNQNTSVKKFSHPLPRKQLKLQKESLNKLLGLGLLASPQRTQHEIHPYVLKDKINLSMLSLS